MEHVITHMTIYSVHVKCTYQHTLEKKSVITQDADLLQSCSLEKLLKLHFFVAINEQLGLACIFCCFFFMYSIRSVMLYQKLISCLVIQFSTQCGVKRTLCVWEMTHLSISSIKKGKKKKKSRKKKKKPVFSDFSCYNISFCYSSLVIYYARALSYIYIFFFLILHLHHPCMVLCNCVVISIVCSCLRFFF